MTAALALGGAACAACCALPLASGLSAFAARAASVGGPTEIVAATAVVLAWLAPRLPRILARPIGYAFACECAPSSLSKDESGDKVIACTLQLDDFSKRAAEIRAIAERHLRKSMRSPLSLHLVYGPEAADDVREMVRKERECCAFLHFDLSVGDEIHLLITSPKEAKEAANTLFDHFAPNLASVTSTRTEGNT
ncbi:MAG: hypothetical protein J0H51_22375 [Rhizobiales bacterium]|nr:hypothetical protein [Hyphomicrobiales bacterium]